MTAESSSLPDEVCAGCGDVVKAADVREGGHVIGGSPPDLCGPVLPPSQAVAYLNEENRKLNEALAFALDPPAASSLEQAVIQARRQVREECRLVYEEYVKARDDYRDPAHSPFGEDDPLGVSWGDRYSRFDMAFEAVMKFLTADPPIEVGEVVRKASGVRAAGQEGKG